MTKYLEFRRTFIGSLLLMTTPVAVILMVLPNLPLYMIAVLVLAASVCATISSRVESNAYYKLDIAKRTKGDQEIEVLYQQFNRHQLPLIFLFKDLGYILSIGAATLTTYNLPVHWAIQAVICVILATVYVYISLFPSCTYNYLTFKLQRKTQVAHK
jgi:hypothetical protein